MLCRHGADFYEIDSDAQQVRVGWRTSPRKHQWVAILYCSTKGSVKLKLRIDRKSHFLSPRGPLKRSGERKSDKEKDTGAITLSDSFPADLPIWIDHAFQYCEDNYGIKLHPKSRAVSGRSNRGFTLPEEVPAEGTYVEGAVRTITVNAYERDQQARRSCIKAHGHICSVCKFDFGARYGPTAEGYIHVHHLRPLSKVRQAHAVDPVHDLRPVCPNCHAVLHLSGKCRTIEEVQKLLTDRRPI
ncbi:MAG TPA: hypothetical protein VHE81_20965 [Lacipirellulaceae bacterium]|nr:hypothetical protein [Lacipirellulaceae bacterium]